MADDSRPLDDLIGSVADGNAIDWQALDRAETNAALRELLRHLQTVAGVADVHRSQNEDSEDHFSGATTQASIPTALGHWGHFLLVGKIGEGGFGEVYHARDTWLDHAVALKLLKLQLIDRSRFLHEARTLAQVRHPNVVTVHGADVHDGRLGFWMEFVEGHTLAEVVSREGVRSASEAAILGQDLCRALAAVHAKGIIHRDIKAQNVMRQSGTGRLVLMDFGAGEFMKTTPAAPSRLTGTPLYLAPELFDGAPPSVRTDIYALGILLFYVTTGGYPVRAGSLEGLIDAHARGDRRHLGDERPDLPDAFVRVIEIMIAHDPARRYATAGHARSALEAVVVPSLPAAPVPEPALRQAYWLRRALAWIVGLIVASTVVTAFGLVNTAAFNLTFGRSGGFASESPLQWFVWGVRSLVAPVTYMAIAMAALTLIVAVTRIVCRLVTPVGATARRARSICEAFARSRELNDPELLMQVVTGAGAFVIAALAWMYWDQVSAFAIYISDAPSQELAALQPAYQDQFDAYARLLDLIIVMYAYGMYFVVKSARRAGTHIHPAVIACAIAVPVLALLLMRELPYRIVYQNDFERVDLENTRCYQIGTQAEALLLHCPDNAPPRNEVVRSTDARLHRLGVLESVFTPREASRRAK